MGELDFLKPYRITFPEFDKMFPTLDEVFERTKRRIIPVEGLVEKNADFVDLGDKYKADFDYDESLDFKTCEVKVENNTLSISFSQEGKHSYREFSYNRSIPNDAIPGTAKAVKKDGKLSVTFEKKK